MAVSRQVDLLEPIDLADHLGKVELYLGQVCQIAGISKMQLDYWTSTASARRAGASSSLRKPSGSASTGAIAASYGCRETRGHQATRPSSSKIVSPSRGGSGGGGLGSHASWECVCGRLAPACLPSF